MFWDEVMKEVKMGLGEREEMFWIEDDEVLRGELEENLRTIERFVEVWKKGV